MLFKVVFFIEPLILNLFTQKLLPRCPKRVGGCEGGGLFGIFENVQKDAALKKR